MQKTAILGCVLFITQHCLAQATTSTEDRNRAIARAASVASQQSTFTPMKKKKGCTIMCARHSALSLCCDLVLEPEFPNGRIRRANGGRVRRDMPHVWQTLTDNT